MPLPLKLLSGINYAPPSFFFNQCVGIFVVIIWHWHADAFACSGTFQLGKLRVNWIIRNDSLLISEWHSPKGTMQLSTMQLISIPEGQGCTVQWQFEQSVGWWPWERLGSMMNEKIMGPQLQTNLQRLSDHLLTTP
ncbi:MAG: hypothetical protein NTZ47_04990 [Bacteroidetes bacterium]|nr:hypothetical protein [Bacteroidota bacterium]